MARLVGQLAPYAGIAIFFWLWVSETQEHAASIERCNTEKMASVAEAERLTREAVQTGLQDRIEVLEQTALDAQRARDIAVRARLEAEGRPARTVEVIKRVRDENACIDTVIPDELVDTIRMRSD